MSDTTKDRILYDGPTIATMKEAFIIAAINEWGGCEGVPSPDQITKLVAAIGEVPGEISAKDIIDILMAKCNIQ